MKGKNKFFAIGYNKTASTTLHALFTKNNIKSIHNYRYKDVAANPKVNFFSDIGDSISIDKTVNYRQLYIDHANTLFILNTRSLNGWLKSKMTHNYWIQCREMLKTEKELANSKYKLKNLKHYFQEIEPYEYAVKLIRHRISEYKKIIQFFKNKKDHFMILDIDIEDWQYFLTHNLDMKNFNIKLNVTSSSGNMYANTENTNIKHIPQEDLFTINDSISSAFKHLRIKDTTNSILPKEFCNNSEAEIIRSYASNLENKTL